MVEGRNLLAKPSVNDLEMWLEYQVRQLGTPMWLGELEAIPGIADLHRFARKKSEHHFMYQKSSPGCSQKKGTPCLQFPEV